MLTRSFRRGNRHTLPNSSISGPGRPARRLSAEAIFSMACLLFCVLPAARAQSNAPTALRKADLQIGGYISFSPTPEAFTPPSAANAKLYGAGGYATLDFFHNLGIELNFKQLNLGQNTNVYERTYEVGPRYVKHLGRYSPYVRASYGRGVFNFPYNTANLAYNLFSGGGGLDVRVQTHINVRGDVEYQLWRNFPTVNLSPTVASVGVAYHF